MYHARLNILKQFNIVFSRKYLSNDKICISLCFIAGSIIFGNYELVFVTILDVKKVYMAGNTDDTTINMYTAFNLFFQKKLITINVAKQN